MPPEIALPETPPTPNDKPTLPAETPPAPGDKQEEKRGNFYQKKLTESLAENESLKRLLEDEKQNKLKEQNNYKELYELEKGKRTQAEEKASKITQSYFNGLKMSAIEQEALKAGIHDSALEDLGRIPSDLVQIETTSSGNANVLGAKEFIEMLKDKKPYLFKSGNPPRMNLGNPTENKPKDLTAIEIVQLQKKDPAAYNKLISDRLKKT